MPLLRIDFQEGFTGDTAVVRINGSEVYRAAPKTRMQIGLADTRNFDFPPQQLEIEFEMPDTGASETLRLSLDRACYLGVSLDQGKRITFKNSREPFGYL